MESNSAIKKKGLLISKTWMDLRAIMLNENKKTNHSQNVTAVGFHSCNILKRTKLSRCGTDRRWPQTGIMAAKVGAWGRSLCWQSSSAPGLCSCSREWTQYDDRTRHAHHAHVSFLVLTLFCSDVRCYLWGKTGDRCLYEGTFLYYPQLPVDL